MAVAKRTLIMVVLGILFLAVGVGGGMFAATRFFQGQPVQNEAVVPNPGPMVELGQFTSTLADSQVHVLKLKVTVELAGIAALERLADPGWNVMMKDEIIKTLKDQKYDQVRYAEGMERLKIEMRDRFNSILPRVNGDLAVRRVLFDEYMAQ
jgi:flagellar FliL protein